MIAKSKIYALIPAYNEEKHIAGVVRDVLAQGIKPLVVDDGSSDKTMDAAKHRGTDVISHRVNQGKGAAIMTGFRYLLENTDFQYVFILDADGQHDAKSCDSFIDRMTESGADVVIGNRMNNPVGMPWDRLWTNRVTSWIISRITGQKIEDCQSGFRLLKRSVVEKLKLKGQRYDIECDMIIEAARLGFCFASVPIQTIYGDEQSHIRPGRDTWRFIKLVGKALCERRKVET